MKIVHITAHMGGGVGHTISDIAVQDHIHTHTVFVLQKPEKKKYFEYCQDSGIEIVCEPSTATVKSTIASDDVVIFHWWHHPAMCRFMKEVGDIQCKSILWSHVSGCEYPFISFEFANLFSNIFFTSGCSFENRYWTAEEKKMLKEKSAIVLGLGKTDSLRAKDDYAIKDDFFSIGYIGTLAKSKMSTEFPFICKRIIEKIPNTRFYLFGDEENGEWIRNESERLGISESVIFGGYVNDVNEKLIGFDVFGYPLNEFHYGTTENSIIEAMSVGLPIVLLNNPAERFIIDNGENGLLADGPEDFAKKVVGLYMDEEYRERIGKAARLKAKDFFDFEKNLLTFQKCIEEMSVKKESRISFGAVLGDKPYDWMMSAVNKDDKEAISSFRIEEYRPIFVEKTKSSLIHFADFFTEDRLLSEQKLIIEKNSDTQGE